MNIDDDDHIDLSGLLIGELTNAEVSEVAEHLDWCEDCRGDLSELAVGHALIAGASRTLGGVAPLENPTDTLPARVSPSRRARRLRQGLVLAAAVVLVVGVGIAGAVRLGSQKPSPDEPDQVAAPFAEANLQPVQGSGTGLVLMVHEAKSTTRMTIETNNLPKLRKGRFYYAWLLDPETNKMLPLGQVGPGGVASFTLSDDLLGRYTVVDVSLEADDGDPEHSVTSVLRASYVGSVNAEATSSS